MKLLTSLLMLSFFFFMAACENSDSVSSINNETELTGQSDLEMFDTETESLAKGFFGSNISVMTRNLYIGTDVANVLNASDPSMVPILAAQALQEIQATNFPERAVALAKEVFFTRPHVIGLQEVQLLRIQEVSDAIIGGTTPATDVLMDYLNIYMKALAAFGLHYKVVAVVENADVELPFVSNPDPANLAFSDIRVTDRDVMLVRWDVRYSDVTAANFSINIPIESLGQDLLRGYVAADLKVGFTSYRVINTHLEPYSELVQGAQAQELLLSLATEELPVVLMGDFNSPAPTGGTYNFIVGNGFTDVWTKNFWKFDPDGFTYGHDDDLLNPVANFTERIDHIFARPGTSWGKELVLRSVFGIVVGDEYFNRTPSGLWPSDHGGVVARLCFGAPPYWALH